MVFFGALVFSIALSADALTAGFTYGLKEIKISGCVLMMIAISCAGAPALAIMLSGFINSYFGYARIVSFAVLFSLGLIKIFDRQLTSLLNKFKRKGKGIISILVKPEDADIDNSKSISIKEGILLSVALSLDGIAGGAFSGLNSPDASLYVFFLSTALTIVAIRLGQALGNRLKSSGQIFSYFGGFLLIILAFFNIIN